MSKIFEALHRNQGPVSKAILSSLFEDGSQPPDSSQAPGASPEAFAVRGRPLQRLRTVSIRLNSAAPLLPFENITSAAAEQYRLIRTRLIQHPKQPQLILVSSAGPADGKSITAVNLAGALSLKSEANVLLADTDFRRSSIHTQLGLEVAPGLTDVLSGTASIEDAVVRIEQFPNLYVIPAGAPRSNPSELLDSAVWTEICKQLRSMFRYVIADSPPVASVADYELLQAACDGVVLVARPDHTKRLGLSTALEIVPGNKLLGVVLNCVPDWFLGRSHYYAPYYYGSNRSS